MENNGAKINQYFKPSIKKSNEQPSKAVEIIDIDSSSEESIVDLGDDNITPESQDQDMTCKEKDIELNLDDINDDNSIQVNPFEKFKLHRNPCVSQARIQVVKNIIKSKIIDKKNTSKSTNEKNPTDDMSNLTSYELNKVRQKWHSFSDSNDPNLENKRFQVLVAARLHARAHEQVVHKAMRELIKLFKSKNKILSAKEMSIAEPESIAHVISFVHFAKSKTVQIVKAAQEIHCQFNGNVPESSTDLQLITGIGPKIANILSIVNTHEAYDQSLKK